MRARMIFRGVVLAAMTLQWSASVAEATLCRPCPDESAAACGSFTETAATLSAIPESDCDSPSPARHGAGEKQCSLCPSCLAPCIGSPAVSLAPDGRSRYVTPSESETLYEAPSFPLLKPPIA